jgi:chromosome segregation ATPase
MASAAVKRSTISNSNPKLTSQPAPKHLPPTPQVQLPPTKDTKKLEEELATTKAQLATTQADVDATKADLATTKMELTTTKSAMDTAETEARSKHDALNSRVLELEEEVAALKKDVATKNEQLDDQEIVRTALVAKIKSLAPQA